ncbi:Cytochrome P450 89A2 [Vitis vinifera]|uniref:Cytochrome P450 89A2 n=1 Tax=Vitis vinifera TaxID=29760 RepID=A0A438CEH3_VITVI|nr:Cytochrome P450 89A2 [Vitis vinifera]
MEIWVFFFIASLCLLPSSNLSMISSSQSSNSHQDPPPFLSSEASSGSHILRRPRTHPPKFTRKYGPILTLRIGSRPAIFISENSLAHQALVQNGAVFSDRPEARPAGRVMNSNQRNISSCPYGPTWRLFRRNLMAEILHPSRVRSYSHARKWVLEILVSRLRSHSDGFVPVRVMDHVQYAMFCLLARFVAEDREGIIRKTWTSLLNLRKDQEEILLPHIRARQPLKQETQSKREEDNSDPGSSSSSKDYVLSAGTDTTSTALQWIMPTWSEAASPGHFVLPHSVTEDVSLKGMTYQERNCEFHSIRAELDPKIGKTNGVQARERDKMMPFGAGRRICPGYGLAMLHLEYFVANLVWNFDWKAVEGDEVDLSEKLEFTVVMKNPLQAHLSPRLK